MTRDGSSEHTIDPGQRWAHLLDELHGLRRQAVVDALRASEEQGFPATAEGVSILVAYALGKISARQYAARMLDSLGLVPPPPEPSHPPSTFDPLPDLGTWRTDERRPSTWQEPERPASTPQPAPWTPATSRVPSREETVRAFLSGRIPVEEFLRLSRVRTT
jgi:antitoxin VbhA-like protein